MKLYTKQGDKGKTQLLSGKIVTKNNLRIVACGCIDELNSMLGVVLAFIDKKKFNKLKIKFEREQKNLIKLAADIVLPIDSTKIDLKRISLKEIKTLENEIDFWQQKLPELKKFLLPGGSKAASFLHLARTICRRTERNFVTLHAEKKINPNCLKYINRFSDWLFQAARILNK